MFKSPSDAIWKTRYMKIKIQIVSFSSVFSKLFSSPLNSQVIFYSQMLFAQYYSLEQHLIIQI